MLNFNTYETNVPTTKDRRVVKGVNLVYILLCFVYEKRAVVRLLIKDSLFILWRIAHYIKTILRCFTYIYVNIYYNICQVSNFVNLLFITLSILSICSGNNFNLTNFPLTLELNLRLLTDRIMDIQA